MELMNMKSIGRRNKNWKHWLPKILRHLDRVYSCVKQSQGDGIPFSTEIFLLDDETVATSLQGGKRPLFNWNWNGLKLQVLRGEIRSK